MTWLHCAFITVIKPEQLTDVTGLVNQGFEGVMLCCRGLGEFDEIRGYC